MFTREIGNPEFRTKKATGFLVAALRLRSMALYQSLCLAFPCSLRLFLSLA